MWKAIDAEYVVNLVLPCFEEDVLTAVNSHKKGAVAFDAIGGGALAMDLLNSSTHEAALRNHNASIDTECC